MPRGTQNSQRKIKGYASTKLKTGYPSKFKKKQNKKNPPPTHSSTDFSYETFLEQMAQRKLQTNFFTCLTWHLNISILQSLKD